MNHAPVRKAVIPVAGLGTRFLPATKVMPKEMLPLVDKPVIQYIVEEAVASGIEEIVFVTSENKSAIEEYFHRNEGLEEILEKRGKQDSAASVRAVSDLAHFVFVEQPDPLGLGHAVLQAKDIIGDEPFVVFGGDDIVEGAPAAKELIDVYERYGSSVIGVMQVPDESVGRYGIMDTAEDCGNGVVKLQGIVEKPSLADAPSRLGAGGRWLLTADIFPLLETTTPGEGGEIQLTDAIRSLLKKSDVYAKIMSGIYRDCGDKLEYAKASIAYALKHPDVGAGVREYIKSLDLK